MKAKATYLNIFCIALLFCWGNSESLAQPKLGIIWDVPADTSEALTQLNQYAYYGIDYLEIHHPAGPQILNMLEGSPFTVLVRTDNKFLVLNKIERDRNSLLKEYRVIANQYRSNFNVASIGLLSNSQTNDSDFLTSFKPIIDSLSFQFNKSFYFYANESWRYFDSPDQHFAVLFNDHEYQAKDLFKFNIEFQSRVKANSNSILFIHSKWFNTAVESYPEFSESLLAYQADHEWKLPLPDVIKEQSHQNWMVLILVLLWLALAIQMKYLPYIRPMLVRYFLAHRFFVDDIIHYRERAAAGGILLMIKHAIFSGVVLYVIASETISETGLNVFFHHYPSLAISGINYASFFLIGMITTLLTQLIALFWLYLPAKNLEHLSQAINLYAGSFFLDFFTVTILLTLFITGFGTATLLTFAGLFVLIWYGAFNIAAFDISGNMGTGRVVYLLITVGLHLAVTATLLGLIFTSNTFLQVLNLATTT